ncbi:hypothetical protein V1291_005202 [Nitrobacteraceae bacterium AZCC 1564]
MLDQQEMSRREDRATLHEDLDRALMVAFCRALETSPLMPMTVLSAMAEAFGSVYRQVADTHDKGECPCGWEPSRAEDIEHLESTFRKAAMSPAVQRLSTMKIAGSA